MEKLRVKTRRAATLRVAGSDQRTPAQCATTGVRSKTISESLTHERQQQIANAAISVFEKKGFAGATLRDIGLAAQLTQGTLYNYIESKEDILFLVCDRIVAKYNVEIEAAISSSPDPVRNLRSLIHRICTIVYENRAGTGVLYREIQHLSPPALEACYTRIMDLMTRLEGAIKEGRPDSETESLRFASTVITFLPAVFALRPWMTPHHIPVDEQIDAMTKFLCLGLGIAER